MGQAQVPGNWRPRAGHNQSLLTCTDFLHSDSAEPPASFFLWEVFPVSSSLSMGFWGLTQVTTQLPCTRQISSVIVKASELGISGQLPASASSQLSCGSGRLSSFTLTLFHHSASGPANAIPGQAETSQNSTMKTLGGKVLAWPEL